MWRNQNKICFLMIGIGVGLLLSCVIQGVFLRLIFALLLAGLGVFMVGCK